MARSEAREPQYVLAQQRAKAAGVEALRRRRDQLIEDGFRGEWKAAAWDLERFDREAFAPPVEGRVEERAHGQGWGAAAHHDARGHGRSRGEEGRERVKQARQAGARQDAEEPRPWRGFVLQQAPHGMRWARVALPESVVERYRVRDHEPADVPRDRRGAFIGTRIAMGDDMITGRGWPSQVTGQAHRNRGFQSGARIAVAAWKWEGWVRGQVVLDAAGRAAEAGLQRTLASYDVCHSPTLTAWRRSINIAVARNGDYPADRRHRH